MVRDLISSRFWSGPGVQTQGIVFHSALLSSKPLQADRVTRKQMISMLISVLLARPQSNFLLVDYVLIVTGTL